MRLVDALSALDAEAIAALCRRRGVAPSPYKRLPLAEQVARALAHRPELGSRAVLSEPARSLLAALARSHGGVSREALGGSALPLVEAALVFAVPGDPTRLALPTAYAVQVPASADDPPHAARLLLAALDDETLRGVLAHHLGRPSVAPRPLLLGEVLEHLRDPAWLDSEFAALSRTERALLEAIEAHGDVVDTALLLDLAREPARYRGVKGPSAIPRRSPANALMRRALLLPVGSDAFAIPHEVSVRLGARRRATYHAVHARLCEDVATVDRAPSRARYALSAGPAAVALLAGLRAAGVSPPPDAGVPRSTLRRIARDVSVDPTQAEMLVALARAAGLGPGPAVAEVRVGDVDRALFDAWRHTVAWDESAPEPDAHRGPRARRNAPVLALRHACFAALSDLPPGRFARLRDVATVVAADPRARACAAALNSPEALDALIARLLVVSLHALGAVDLGHDSSAVAGHPEPARVEGGMDWHEDVVVRLSARARAWLLADAPPPAVNPGTADASGGHPLLVVAEGAATDPDVETARGAGRAADVCAASSPAVPDTTLPAGLLVVPPTALLSDVLAVARAARPWLAQERVWLEVTAATVAAAFAAGVSETALRARLARLPGGASPAIAEIFAEALRRRPRAWFVPVGGLVRVEDDALRAALRAAPDTAELFLPDDLPSGLLLRAGVSVTRVARAVHRAGGDLHAGGPRDDAPSRPDPTGRRASRRGSRKPSTKSPRLPPVPGEAATSPARDAPAISRSSSSSAAVREAATSPAGDPPADGALSPESA